MLGHNTIDMGCGLMVYKANGTKVVQGITNKFNQNKKKHMHIITLSTLSTELLLGSVFYATIGIVILVLAFVIIEKLTPKHNLWKEIVEEKNTALALVAGFFMLAIAIIIASAIH